MSTHNQMICYIIEEILKFLISENIATFKLLNKGISIKEYTFPRSSVI
jgi:hypothetical protein